ncbi:MAG: nitroreductase family protein [Nanoarchaeota archaeon]|nr:nitroreductase family protein [Nanoarchaeota archaeon]
MDALENIHSRRSVRHFFNYPVPTDKVYAILEAAHAAPSSGNLDSWEFLVVDDEKKILEISSACNTQFWISDAPMVIIVLSDTDRVKRIYGNRGEFYSIQNSSAAVQNLLLAANAVGLGACWVGAFQEKEIKCALEIPDNRDVHAVIVVGDKAADPPKPKRKEVEYKCFFNKYGKRKTD